MMNFSGSELKTQAAVLLVSLFSVLTVACSKDQPERVEIVKVQPFADTLQARSVALKNDSLLYPLFRIRNIGDKYLLLFYRKENNFFHVYTLPAMEFLYEWGHQGKGPDEFIQPPDYLNHNSDTLIIHDMVQKELRSYRISDSTLQNMSSQTLIYNNQRSPLNGIQRINDSLYFATYGIMSETTKNEYIALRPGDKELLFRFGKYPETELTGWEKFSEFSKTNAVKPDGSIFVFFYRNYDKFKLFSPRGELLKSVHIQDPSVPENNASDDTTYRYVYHASDQYIYSAEVYESADSLKKHGAPYRTSLEVWDWTGKSVYRAKLDQPINQFTVSEKHQKLYGTSLDNRNVVFEYDIPDILGLD